MENKKKIILANVEDLVSDLLYYDRKESENLKVGEIQEQIDAGNITVEEIIDCFKTHLTNGINT